MQRTHNVPVSALHFSALPGTYQHTHSCPRSIERHCELLTSVDGACPGSFCNPQHLISGAHTAFDSLVFLAQLTSKSCCLLPHNLS